MKKVAYNNKYGGFGISHAVLDRMIELGHSDAILKKKELDLLQSKHDCHWKTVYLEDPKPAIKRHDPILIQAIEELGDSANGECASIKIEEMNDNDHYQIKEYDGKETLKILNLYCDCC
jgi:hypothetical protein